jgi:hypothetical protein
MELLQELSPVPPLAQALAQRLATPLVTPAPELLSEPLLELQLGQL